MECEEGRPSSRLKQGASICYWAILLPRSLHILPGWVGDKTAGSVYMDIGSAKPSTFDAADALWLEKLVELL